MMDTRPTSTKLKYSKIGLFYAFFKLALNPSCHIVFLCLDCVYLKYLFSITMMITKEGTTEI